MLKFCMENKLGYCVVGQEIGARLRFAIELQNKHSNWCKKGNMPQEYKVASGLTTRIGLKYGQHIETCAQCKEAFEAEM